MSDNLIPAEILAIAATGVRLVPVSGEKIPRIKEWPTQASADPAVIGVWASQFQSPRTNWAALTGPESGFWSLDTDAAAGAQWITQQTEVHGTEWLATRKVRTGRRTGGYHYYFQWPVDGTILHSSAGKIAPGVDVKALHGLAILPPSLHSSGRYYAWATPLDHPILPAPDWLLALVIAASGQFFTPAKKNGKSTIPDGERNDTLFRLGCSMRGRGMSEEAITAGLLAENASACSPPLPESEVTRIAASAASHAPEPPEPRLILSTPAKPTMATKLEFETAAEFAAQAPAETDWLVPPFIPAKSLVELIGKLKESGKTSFALLMVKALLSGESFLERVCQKTPIVYLSEQSAASLRSSLAKAGLLDQTNLHLLRWHKAMGVKWEEIADAAVEKAVQVGAKLLVVDTLGPFAGLVGDAENSSSVALEVLRPLQTAQEKRLPA